jgi:tRNA pseudouridine55 synthase
MTGGLLLVDKPAGPTSHDIVDAIRRALGGPRCGHAGTLDPFASGLLVVAVGRATRLLRFLSAAEKSYEGLVRLGFGTDTDDATGRPLSEPRPVGFAAADLHAALAALEGEFDQVSPAYSARKHEGVPLYRLARRGLASPSKSARVRVRWEQCEPLGPDLLRIRVTVSAGTYIRALARDLGEALGCGGHLAELRRLASGPFRVAEAVPFPADRETLERVVVPVDAIPLGLPAVTVAPEQARLVRVGARQPASPLPQVAPDTAVAPRPLAADDHFVRVLDGSGQLLAIAELLESPEGPVLQPRVVLVD